MVSKHGSFRIARVGGIGVYVHWSWLLVAVWQIQVGQEYERYSAGFWYALEYVALFGIVLLHEFGHAFACRSVGGRADTIVLWPLGGVAFVQPPARPGATLWSVAAGPLVNVLLLLVLVPLGLPWLKHFAFHAPAPGDLWTLLGHLCAANLLLLVFNLLPIYPLDGGQILSSILWYLVGRETSLKVSTSVGMAGGAGLFLLAAASQQVLLMVMAGFMALQSYGAYRYASRVGERLQGPRHPDVACPGCGSHPVAGPYWRCTECGARFDTFEYAAMCPGCGFEAVDTQCPECRRRHPWAAWRRLPEPGVTDWRV